MAEISNPFLVIRTIFKIKGIRDTTLYQINEVVFAAVFIPVRMFLTPLVLIYMLEGDKVIYATKFGITFVLFIQLIWCYRILFMVVDKIKGFYEARGTKAPLPLWLSLSHRFFYSLDKNMTTKKCVSVFNFLWICVLPHWYYSQVRGTLFNF